MKTAKSKKLGIAVLFIIAAILLTSCADVSPHEKEFITSYPYGFWSGLWHGIISPIAFIGSLIYDDIAIYAYENNVGWYDFGFILGVGGLCGGSSRA